MNFCLVFTEEKLQPSDHLCGPELDPLQHVPIKSRARHSTLGWRSMRSEWESHLSLPAGHMDFGTSQDTRYTPRPLGSRCTWLGHAKLLIQQQPKSLLQVFSQSVLHPDCVCSWDRPDPGGGACQCPCCSWGSHRSCQVCQDPSRWHLFPLVCWLHHTAWSHQQTFWVKLIQLFILPKVKMLNSSGPSTSIPWGTPIITGLHSDIKQLAASLEWNHTSNYFFTWWSVSLQFRGRVAVWNIVKWRLSIHEEWDVFLILISDTLPVLSKYIIPTFWANW